MHTAPDLTRLAAELERDGYCIIRGALTPGLISEIDHHLSERFAITPMCQGGFYGETTQRFGRLLLHSPAMPTIVRHAVVLAIVERLLLAWCDCIQLNTTQAIAVHPGALAQLPHRDQDMWPVPKGEAEYLVNVMWPLTPFTTDNGATLIWPRSHGSAALEEETHAMPVSAKLAPGDALVFLGSTLHGAGANCSTMVRRGIVVGYSLGWLKPYENQLLAYPPEVARTFDPELAALIGYRQHRPNLGNYEGQCPSVLLGSGPDADRDAARAAIDALRPDQSALVKALASGGAANP